MWRGDHTHVARRPHPRRGPKGAACEARSRQRFLACLAGSAIAIPAVVWFWLPEKTIADRRHLVDYDAWIKAGHLRAIPGAVIDLGVFSPQTIVRFSGGLAFVGGGAFVSGSIAASVNGILVLAVSAVITRPAVAVTFPAATFSASDVIRTYMTNQFVE